MRDMTLRDVLTYDRSSRDYKRAIMLMLEEEQFRLELYMSWSMIEDIAGVIYDSLFDDNEDVVTKEDIDSFCIHYLTKKVEMCQSDIAKIKAGVL